MPAEYGSLPFREQIAFFRQKVNVPTARWADLWKQQHDVGFMVAGAAKADLLAEFRGAVEKAITEGTTLAQFRKDFDQIVERHGWRYKGGRGWRTRVIYQTNLRQSYNAGREAQMADPALRARRPYGLYRHGGSQDPRPEHLAWDGLVIPLDDPWWDTHTPMNGWGCSCKKFAVSERDLRRMGKDVPDKPPNDGSREWVDPVTGEVHQVPNGIDPGFDYTPGASRVDRVRAQLLQKADGLPGPLGTRLREAVDNPPPAPPPPSTASQVGALWSRSNMMFSTIRGLDQAGVDDVLSRVPGAAPQLAKVGDFMAAHPIRALFLKQSEMSHRSGASATIGDSVRRFLGVGPDRSVLYAVSRPGRLNGFTSPRAEHVVVKAPARASVAKVDPQALADSVDEALNVALFGQEGMATSDGRRLWSLSQALRQRGDINGGMLVTLVHEIGHQVHYWAGTPARPNGAGSLTAYAHTNHREWHAEHFAAWLLNREALAGWDAEIAGYFDDLVERAARNTRKGG